ncbi:MAG: hypothetical protein HN350_01500 [Phycisphaerales bacterium]|nr:hypothetical protein [Phycisphaerales bacterium]
MSNTGTAALKPAKLGTLLALLTILYSFAMGAGFGLYEEKIKGHLKDEAAAVKDKVYQGDEVKMKKITDKSWVYLKRAHMHASGLGIIALGISLLLGILNTCSFCKFIGSTCLGLGALGYSVFWMLAGLTAPGLGSTGAAKEALKMVAMPSAGLCLLAMLFVFMAFLKSSCSGGCCRQDD